MSSEDTSFGGTNSKEAFVSTKTPSERISIITWSVEGLESVKRSIPMNILTTDVIILTETFNTRETCLQGYYTYEVLATKGHAGRPSGGITCLIKPHLAPAQLIYRTPNLLVLDCNYIVTIGAYFQPDYTAQDNVEAFRRGLSESRQKQDSSTRRGPQLSYRSAQPQVRSRTGFSNKGGSIHCKQFRREDIFKSQRI